MADNREPQPSSIEFWIDQANELKKAADYCWTLEKTVEHESVEGEIHGLARSILNDAADIDSELKWLYGQLMAFAIQYLSIGILIHKNPYRFLNDAPGNRIVALTEECGVTLNQLQKAYLRQVENAFEWDRKFPRWNVPLTRNELINLKVKHVAEKTIRSEERKALEALFNTLSTLAVDRFGKTKKANQQPD